MRNPWLFFCILIAHVGCTVDTESGLPKSSTSSSQSFSRDADFAAENYAKISEDGKVAVATVSPYASLLAIQSVARGGNAIDAALTAAFALGVVDGHNSGIGGGCFILVRLADGRILAIDGREMAPAAATASLYVQDGKVNADLSRNGPLAVGIPGSVAALYELQKLGGQLSFSDVILPVADLAERGIEISPSKAQRIAATADRLAHFPAAASIFLDSDGKPLPAFAVLQQKDLANTYRKLAAQGPDFFYKGEFAQKVAQWMKENGGIITAEDFANYHTVRRDPIVSEFAGYVLYGFPSPSSGGTHVAQILNILEHFELQELTFDQRYHLLAEAMKLAFADRAQWLGDADFTEIPSGLTDKRYAKTLAQKINLERALTDVFHGNPAEDISALMNKHTTHIAAADLAGNWVAITSTVNTSFGSKVVVPGTGVILNNQMDDFSVQPGAANAFGLIGTEANSIQPGKRPLSSMSPTLVFKDGTPVMTFGAAGGPTIISQVVQALMYALHDQMPLQEAIRLPRIHQQWHPSALYVEAAMPEDIRRALEQKGHQLNIWPSIGATQAIQLRNGKLYPLAEPRVITQNSKVSVSK